MKKTFTTIMPDKVGVFLSACEIMKLRNLNITRVSYNKAVDLHILFLEVEGDPEDIRAASEQLEREGYVSVDPELGNVVLLEFTLPDVPGSLCPVLELIRGYEFNISYMSSHADGSGVQHFRIGMMVEKQKQTPDFLRKASLLCETKIIDYNKCEQVLDNTVFYLSFANQIAERLNLSKDHKMDLIVNSNLIMEELRDKPLAQFHTFDYISRFADFLSRWHGDRYAPAVSRLSPAPGLTILVIEPPCGSNITLFLHDGGLVCVDGGMCCYAEETMHSILENTALCAVPDNACLILTHSDVDHCGLLNRFSNIRLSPKALENFTLESEGNDNLRERNPLHAPYVRISKLLSGYTPPELPRLFPLAYGNRESAGAFRRMEDLKIGDLKFEVWEGSGGHVAGEILLIERAKRLVLTGDIFVNVKESEPRQHDFNLLAPYLMTSVDTNPALARKQRQDFFALLSSGRWQILPGHGHPFEYTISD